jgi:hypothetical protein
MAMVHCSLPSSGRRSRLPHRGSAVRSSPTEGINLRVGQGPHRLPVRFPYAPSHLILDHGARDGRLGGDDVRAAGFVGVSSRSRVSESLSGLRRLFIDIVSPVLLSGILPAAPTSAQRGRERAHREREVRGTSTPRQTCLVEKRTRAWSRIRPQLGLGWRAWACRNRARPKGVAHPHGPGG